jgi:pyochelin synthetase
LDKRSTFRINTDNATEYAEAQGPELDNVVAEAWERVLGVPASKDDRLLDLLVHEDGEESSRQLGLLLSEINVATGFRLPLSIAFHSPTAAEIAGMVRKHQWLKYERPIPILPGVGQPLFVFPGLGAMGLDMVTLLHSLSFPGPVYLNPPAGIDGSEPHDTMSSIVADHLAFIRPIQPSGPYWLLGYSWGALVALEISRSLLSCNEEVAFVGMIDPVLGESDWTYDAWIGYMGKRLSHHLAELRQITSVSAAVQYSSKRIVPLIGRSGRFFGFKQWTPLAGVAENLPAPLNVVCAAEIRAIDAYRLQSYDGPAAIFTTRHGHGALSNPRKVWSAKLSQLDLQWVPGDHTTILTRPGVTNLADVISAAIAACPRH